MGFMKLKSSFWILYSKLRMVDFLSDGKDISVLSLTSFYETEGSLFVSPSYVCSLEVFILSLCRCEISSFI